MTTAETLTIIVKAMTNLDPMKMSSRQMDRDERKVSALSFGGRIRIVDYSSNAF